MKTLENKQNALKRVFALFSTVCIVFALVGVLAVGVSASSVTSFGGYEETNNYTILYNPTVSASSGLQEWIYLSNSEFLYTDIYMCFIYKANSSINGVWNISTDGVSASFRLDNFNQSSNYQVAVTYIDGFTLANSSSIQIQYITAFGTPNIDIKYILISNTVDEIYVGEVADFMAENENFSQYNNVLFVNTIRLNTIGYRRVGYDQGYNSGKNYWYGIGYGEGKNDGRIEGYEEGKDIGYSEGYEEGKDIGYSEGYVEGSDGIGIEKLPFAVTDSIANMFVTITNFEILGINVLGLLGSIISICVVAFVIKKVL